MAKTRLSTRLARMAYGHWIGLLALLRHEAPPSRMQLTSRELWVMIEGSLDERHQLSLLLDA